MSKRAERIKNTMGIESVLSRYGYNVQELNREQQFRCDLHGDGNDNAPSARVYPDTNTWYCFACGKTRDVIATVMEKEGMTFAQACTNLEKLLGLEVWEYNNREDEFQGDFEISKETLEEKGEIIKRRLEIITKERAISFKASLKLWEAVNFLSLAKESQSHAQWDKIAERITKEIEDG